MATVKSCLCIYSFFVCLFFYNVATSHFIPTNKLELPTKARQYRRVNVFFKALKQNWKRTQQEAMVHYL